MQQSHTRMNCQPNVGNAYGNGGWHALMSNERAEIADIFIYHQRALKALIVYFYRMAAAAHHHQT